MTAQCHNCKRREEKDEIRRNGQLMGERDLQVGIGARIAFRRGSGSRFVSLYVRYPSIHSNHMQLLLLYRSRTRKMDC